SSSSALFVSISSQRTSTKHEHGSYHVLWNSRNIEMTSQVSLLEDCALASSELASRPCRTAPHRTVLSAVAGEAVAEFCLILSRLHAAGEDLDLVRMLSFRPVRWFPTGAGFKPAPR